jgi:hypothetical protein
VLVAGAVRVELLREYSGQGPITGKLTGGWLVIGESNSYYYYRKFLS